MPAQEYFGISIQVNRLSAYALTLAILLFCFTIFSVSALTASKTISVSGMITYGLSWLHTEGKQIKDARGRTVYLRGVARGTLSWTDVLWSQAPPPYEEYLWHNPVESDWDTIKRLGVNVITVPVGIEVFFPSFGMATGEEPRSEYVTLLDNFVDWSEERNIYVIPTLHGYYDEDKWPDDLWTNPIRKQHIDEFWLWLAERYKDRPVVCGIDCMNEPWHKGCPDNLTWRDWVESVIDKVRAVNPNLLFFVEPGNIAGCTPNPGESCFDWMYDTPVRRDNIILCPHLYPYTGDWDWLMNVPWGAAYEEGRYDEGKQILIDWLQQQYCTDLNYPFMMEEFACRNHTVGLEWLKDILEIMNSWGWSYMYWAWQAYYAEPDIWLVEGDWHILMPQGEVLRAHLL